VRGSGGGDNAKKNQGKHVNPALCATAGAAVRGWWPLLLVAALTACGGGGGGGGPATATSVATATTAALSITGFTPSAGGVGSTITVAGAGSRPAVGQPASVATTFTVVSDGQLQLTVPQGAQTGRIELTVPGRSVLSSTDFIVNAVPQLASLSPTSVLPGARVTLTGSNLDRVAEVRVNTAVLRS